MAGVARHLLQLKKGAAGQCSGYTLAGEPGRQALGLDVGIACAVNPVAQVGVVQAALQQGDDAGLGLLFDLADGAHGVPLRGAEIKLSLDKA